MFVQNSAQSAKALGGSEACPLSVHTRLILCIQWNLSITDTIRKKHFVPYSEVPNSGASGLFPVGMVLRNRAVEHNVS